MDAADQAYVFFSEHTLEMKKLPPITPADIQNAFVHKNLKVLTDNSNLKNDLKDMNWTNQNLLMMSSGTFNGLNLNDLASSLNYPSIK